MSKFIVVDPVSGEDVGTYTYVEEANRHALAISRITKRAVEIRREPEPYKRRRCICVL